jgi:hypothetical protein
MRFLRIMGGAYHYEFWISSFLAFVIVTAFSSFAPSSRVEFLGVEQRERQKGESFKKKKKRQE